MGVFFFTRCAFRLIRQNSKLDILRIWAIWQDASSHTKCIHQLINRARDKKNNSQRRRNERKTKNSTDIFLAQIGNESIANGKRFDF